MKFAVLSGAYKNAGDFLIVERCINLLKYVFPDCEIKIYERRESLQPYIDEINSCDALVFAGGPAYKPKIYPGEIPLVENLDDITTKFLAVGMGWYAQFGADGFNHAIYETYTFTEKTTEMLKRIEKDSALTSRDLLTVRTLKNNGFDNVIMTGCPAWYDLENVSRTTLRDGINLPYKKICISDPGRIENCNAAYEVAEFMKSKYPDAEINFVFHRGIHQDSMTSKRMADAYEKLAARLEKAGINVIDISYSAKGFEVYDDCDLHIGFRVHAHIYNLGKRNISILIEEDGRGAGQNDALGLMHIKPIKDIADIPAMRYGFVGKIIRWFADRFKTDRTDNNFLTKNIDDYLYLLESSDYLMLNHAFELQKKYFDIMVDFLRKTMEA